MEMISSQVTVSGQEDQAGHKATEELPTRATATVAGPGTGAEADPVAAETAATEEEGEITDGSPWNLNLLTLTTTTTEPKGRKSPHLDHPEETQAKDLTGTPETVTAMTR